MKQLTAAVTSVLVSMTVASAAQPDCLQKLAVYSDENSAYQLEFTIPKEGSGIMSNRFNITAKGTGLTLDGWVIWSDDVGRPNGIITHQCPGGDITGEELDKCKIWEGVVYSVFPDGAVDLLPPEGDAASPALLLPDFGRALKKSKAWAEAKLQVVPWDLFTFEKCAPAN